MAEKTDQKPAAKENPGADFIIQREFDAPRELVWKAWTEREHLMEWFGAPQGCKIVSATMDFRPGGVFHYCIRMPDGKEMWRKFVYREIVAPERFVLVTSFADAAGNTARHPFSPAWPLEMLSTLTFEEKAGKTLFTLKWTLFNPTDEERKAFESARPGMAQGWQGMFLQLDSHLAKNR